MSAKLEMIQLTSNDFRIPFDCLRQWLRHLKIQSLSTFWAYLRYVNIWKLAKVGFCILFQDCLYASWTWMALLFIIAIILLLFDFKMCHSVSNTLVGYSGQHGWYYAPEHQIIVHWQAGQLRCPPFATRQVCTLPVCVAGFKLICWRLSLYGQLGL